MDVAYRGPNFTITESCDDLKDAFAHVARCEDLFEGTRECQNCKGTDLRPRYAQTQAGHEYYSLICKSCRWEFKYGQRKSDGGLFPKGWEPPYQKERESDDSARTSQEETARQGRDRF
jgi:hypothetical protein